MYDSFGDGWNGAEWSLRESTLLWTNSISYSYSQGVGDLAAGPFTFGITPWDPYIGDSATATFETPSLSSHQQHLPTAENFSHTDQALGCDYLECAASSTSHGFLNDGGCINAGAKTVIVENYVDFTCHGWIPCTAATCSSSSNRWWIAAETMSAFEITKELLPSGLGTSITVRRQRVRGATQVHFASQIIDSYDDYDPNNDDEGGWVMNLGFMCNGHPLPSGNRAIIVGSHESGSGTKEVTSPLPEGVCGLSCPGTVTQNNWLGDANVGDTFSITTSQLEDGSGVSVSAVRTDSGGYMGGWDMMLAFVCTETACTETASPTSAPTNVGDIPTPTAEPTPTPTAEPTAAIVEIWIGSSSSSGSKALTESYCELVCPSTVDQSNWLSPDANDDSFQVVVSALLGGGSRLLVTRLAGNWNSYGDSWGMNLG
jgi:hypothetical protein